MTIAEDVEGEAHNIARDSDALGEDGRGPWLFLALSMAIFIGLSLVLNWLVEGVPLGFVIPVLNEPASVSSIILHVTVVAMGAYVGYLGSKELVEERRFSVEFLMAVAALGAVYLDFLFEGATVLMLYAIAEYFEGYIEDRARKTLETLSGYMPDEARIVENGSERALDVKEVEPGMVMVIRPGGRIPLDGTVSDGQSLVDQSVVTGESMPVLRKVGDLVYAGTMNMDGVLRVLVTKGVEGTLVSRIVKLVMESRARKASVERLVDRFAKIYVPVIILLALFTATVMPAVVGQLDVWLYRSLILLVVSCPSAFVVSVPATIFTAITLATRKGVIIKGGVYVEKMASVRAVVFDKTGTLTLGTPNLAPECSSPTLSDSDVLAYAAGLEQYSKHPMAKVFVDEASSRGLDLGELDVKDVREIPGRGVMGSVNGRRVIVGSPDLMPDSDSTSGCEADAPRGDAHSKVFISIDNDVIAECHLADRTRGGASEVVARLRGMGLRTAMLTGDKAGIAKEIGEELGVDEIHPDLLPEDKLKLVDEFKKRYGLVAMVGDGINDAPALAASDVGIAMGGKGVDAALESADIILVRDELITVPYVHKLSRSTMRVAKENIAVSLGVKLLLGALGFLGFVPLWFAVAAGDDGVTMLLLLNTLRLTRVEV